MSSSSFSRVLSQPRVSWHFHRHGSVSSGRPCVPRKLSAPLTPNRSGCSSTLSVPTGSSLFSCPSLAAVCSLEHTPSSLHLRRSSSSSSSSAGLISASSRRDSLFSLVSSRLPCKTTRGGGKPPQGDAEDVPGLLELPGVHTPEQLVALGRRAVLDCEQLLATGGAPVDTFGTASSDVLHHDETDCSESHSPRACLGSPTSSSSSLPSSKGPKEVSPESGASVPCYASAALAPSSCSSHLSSSTFSTHTHASPSPPSAAPTTSLEAQARRAVQALDAVSNTLCKVADAAELIRYVTGDFITPGDLYLLSSASGTLVLWAPQPHSTPPKRYLGLGVRWLGADNSEVCSLLENSFALFSP